MVVLVVICVACAATQDFFHTLRRVEDEYLILLLLRRGRGTRRRVFRRLLRLLGLLLVLLGGSGSSLSLAGAVPLGTCVAGEIRAVIAPEVFGVLLLATACAGLRWGLGLHPGLGFLLVACSFDIVYFTRSGPLFSLLFYTPTESNAVRSRAGQWHASGLGQRRDVAERRGRNL